MSLSEQILKRQQQDQIVDDVEHVKTFKGYYQYCF